MLPEAIPAAPPAPLQGVQGPAPIRVIMTCPVLRSSRSWAGTWTRTQAGAPGDGEGSGTGVGPGVGVGLGVGFGVGVGVGVGGTTMRS